MSVEPGRELLHYRVVDKIGEGGMGVVWRAVDTALDREVAIKVLPQGLDQDAERLERFEREAKLLASLHHPNIAAVYGLHEHDGLRFIAMELVAGEDLAERLQAGALDLDEALTVARQVAAALATAHDHGIVHRDLKPANIRLAADGTVKVLDFGLAKALDPTATSGPANLTHSPTLTSAGTRAGVILGTAAYMSPEQARGKPVDRRADIWAFGCVLYEMLTGRQAFAGDTVTDVLAAILTREIDVDALAGRVPRRVVRLLRRCLTKDATRRLRDAGDIGLELDAVLAGDRDVGAEAEGPARRPWGLIAAVAGAALALGALLAHLAGAAGGNAASGPPPTRKVAVTVGDDARIRGAGISRDGQLLILTLDDGAYVRRLDDFELRPIPESNELTSWVESPDGRSIAFFTEDDQILGGGTLRRMSLDTGTTVTLRGSSEGLNPLLWVDDGILVYGEESIRRIELGSNEVLDLVKLDRGHSHFTTVIPGTDTLLMELHDPGGADEWSLIAVDLDDGTQQPVVGNAKSGVVTANGFLLFLRDDTLIATRFDAAGTAVIGDPVPLIPGVWTFGVSEDGTLIYLPTHEGSAVRRIARVGRDGAVEPLYAGRVEHVRYGPDGRWVSVSAGESFLLVDPRNGSVRTLPNEGVRFSDHVWRPDGGAVVYTAYPMGGGGGRLVEHPIDGSAPRVLLDVGTGETEVFPTGYAPDGSGFLFAEYDKSDTDLWWMPAGGGDARPVLATSASEDLARFAPHGRWVAYESTETGRQEVWVAVFRSDGPTLAEKWRVSREGGRDPVWSVTSDALTYETFDGRLVSVAVTENPDGTPAFGAAEDALDLRALGAFAQGDESYDALPGDDGWVMVLGGSEVSREVRVVFGWFAELERLVRGG